MGKKLEKVLIEFEKLSHKNDEESNKMREKLVAEIENLATKEDSEMLANFAEKGFRQIEEEIEILRMQIESENYKLLPISHIAEKYFGKSRQWLYQRLNGSYVRGKVYTLNSEQKKIFNNAVQDIAKRISSIHLA